MQGELLIFNSLVRLCLSQRFYLPAVFTGKIYKGEKDKGEMDPTKIADATIITPYLVNKDFKVIIAKDQFQRVTPETFVAQIN